uniref:Uncharacterized protein n=1 Tax=Anguilla anguilla TaxID=7936 RepID=A0A0E9R7H3_ANGAN
MSAVINKNNRMHKKCNLPCSAGYKSPAPIT